MAVFARNFLSLGSIQLLNYFIPFLILPWVLAKVGVENYGRLGFSTAVVAYILTIVDYGFTYAGTKEISKNKENSITVVKCYVEILTAKFILFLGALILLLPFLIFIDLFNHNWVLIIFTISYIPGQILFSEFLFQGIERMEKIAILNALVKIGSAALVVLLVKGPDDLYIIPLANALAYSACGVIAIFMAKKYGYGFCVSYINFQYALRRIKTGFNVFLSVFTPNLYNNFSTILLAFFAPMSIVGAYDLAKKIVSIFEQFIYIYNRVFFPILARDFESHKKYFKFGLLATAVSAVGIAISAPYAINIVFGTGHEDVIKMLRAFSAAPFLLFLSTAFGTSYLYIKGYDRHLRNSIFIASGIAFLFSGWAVPSYAGYGAIATILLGRGLMFLVAYIYINKQKL